jgi:hypothetical protein
MQGPKPGAGEERLAGLADVRGGREGRILLEALLEAAAHGLVDRGRDEGQTPHWVATLVGQALAEAGVGKFRELVTHVPHKYPEWVRSWLDREGLQVLWDKLDRVIPARTGKR